MAGQRGHAELVKSLGLLGMWGAVALLLPGCQPAGEVGNGAPASVPGQASKTGRETVMAKKDQDSPPADSRQKVPDATSTNPGLQGEVAPVPGVITEVGIEQLFLLKGEGRVLVVDVRPRVFFAMGHIEGATSLPLKSFESAYPKKKPAFDAAVAAGQVIVLYCADLNCPDGYAVAKRLSARGYSTSLYKGGWAEWKAAGLE